MTAHGSGLECRQSGYALLGRTSVSDRRLIEEWLPIAEIGIEGTRERTPRTPFPAPNRLHVWWARRPLVASRAAVLGTLLPTDADRERFLHVLGIHGDPVAARAVIARALRTGVRVDNPYEYDRAFKYSPSNSHRQWMHGAVRAQPVSQVRLQLHACPVRRQTPVRRQRHHAVAIRATDRMSPEICRVQSIWCVFLRKQRREFGLQAATPFLRQTQKIVFNRWQ